MKFFKQLNGHFSWPPIYRWAMTKSEKQAFDQCLQGAKEFLEFGSGGSTIRAINKSQVNIHSVDSSEEWIQYLRKFWVVKRSEKKRLTFTIVDIGRTKKWGHPMDDSAKHLFPNYSSHIFDQIDPSTLNVILIDGRFRVACTLKSILHVAQTGKESPTILIHDFWHREFYHPVLKYLETVNKADSLGVFKLKGGIDLEEVEKDYEQFKFDPR